jgi:hypothetical protein
MTMALFVVKLFYGALFINVVMRPPKKEYEFIHRGQMGHMKWRVQRVKITRRVFSNYFVASAVAVCFGVM